MQSRLDDFRDADARVVAICTEPPETALEYADYYGFEFSLLSDPDLATIRAYGLLHENGGLDGDIARPATLILDRDGRVAWRHLTDNWRIRPRAGDLLEVLAGLE